MRKEASLPVRLDPEEKRQLQAIAERMKITVSTLIRLLVSSYVEYYEREGGRVTMPLEWSEILGTDLAAARKVADKPISYVEKKPRSGAGG